ncbi:quercetin 2,3-dioxygenase [Saccharothrix obliqua]|uniref:quercetin 2,3-dioxygenase n=1 Tax=Saccharothrix obliqua TaxID=2861747 RepID=UPI001C5EEEDF|nr:quercetin 2,3-dioxygenase [Saccharothrix obliqua]MBW4717990.1 quercetin 2,3-dioxygenase [Saccharothrix obliqua]
MTEIQSATRPVHVPAGEGEAVWLNGDVYAVKLDREASGGSLTVLEADVPPGGGPPIHNHVHEDEAFYVLAGELEIHAGGRTYTAVAGDLVFIPRGTFHAFRNRTTRVARQLLLFTPGGFEGFFRELGREAVPGTPPPPTTPNAVERVVEVGTRYGSFPPPGNSDEPTTDSI